MSHAAPRAPHAPQKRPSLPPSASLSPNPRLSPNTPPNPLILFLRPYVPSEDTEPDRAAQLERDTTLRACMLIGEMQVTARQLQLQLRQFEKDAAAAADIFKASAVTCMLPSYVTLFISFVDRPSLRVYKYRLPDASSS